MKETDTNRSITGLLQSEPGHAYTIWGILDAGAGNYKIAGRVAGNGKFGFGGKITEDTIELHVIDHGPAISGEIFGMINVPGGGCAAANGPNDCRVAVIPTP